MSSGPKEKAYEISWAKLRDDAGMRMQDAEALVLRALRLVHDSKEFQGEKPPSDNPKVVAFIYANNARSIAVAKKLGYKTGGMFPTTRKLTCKSATSYVKSLPPSCSSSSLWPLMRFVCDEPFRSTRSGRNHGTALTQSSTVVYVFVALTSIVLFLFMYTWHTHTQVQASRSANERTVLEKLSSCSASGLPLQCAV